MKDHSKKLNNLKENNESIFGELFGFGKKNPETPHGLVQKIDVGKYRMGNSLIVGIPGATDSEILNFDWKNSALSWLLDCEFEGVLNLDLDKEVLKAFGGIWKKGVFKGLVFSNHSTSSFGLKGQDSQVQFGDGVIKPRYAAPYTTWHVSPMNFVDGTIDRETGGILGVSDSPNMQITNTFNILSLIPGKAIKIISKSNLPVRTDSGKMGTAPSVIHTIKMIKRIDAINSDITLEITNGDNQEVFIKTFPWSEFRKGGIESLYFTPGKTINFFGIDLSNKKVFAEVIETGKSSLSHEPQTSVKPETPTKPQPSVSKGVQPKIRLSEIDNKSIVNKIKDIISENLKHY